MQLTVLVVVAIIAGAMLFTMFSGYWLWNIPPVHVFTPVQTQPLSIKLAGATDVDQLPANWFVKLSRRRSAKPDRLVYQPAILGHDLAEPSLAGDGRRRVRDRCGDDPALRLTAAVPPAPR